MRELRLALAIDAVDGEDREELDWMTRNLQDELELLGMDSPIERPDAGELPAGAKSATAITFGTLVVGGAFSRSALRALVDLVAEWRRRTGARKVSIVEGEDSLTLEGLTPVEQRELVEAWIQRRQTGDGDAGE